MSKHKKASTQTQTWTSHGPAEHQVVPLWNGTVQATNGRDLNHNFKDYDLCLFLADSRIPNDVPFCLGINGPKSTPAIVLFAIPDRGAPDDGPYWEWLKGTLRKALKDGKALGIACMGGHGRTGTIIATLWGLASAEANGGTPLENPITAIREIIGCDEEVESKVQEEFVYQQTGFPPPEIRIFADKSSFVFASHQGTSAWVDRDGKALFPISMEPSGLLQRPYVVAANVLVGKTGYRMCTQEGFAIPTTMASAGMPDQFCDICRAAMGYAFPVTPESKLTCTVCPILKEVGATKRKAWEAAQAMSKKALPPGDPAYSTKGLGEDCDFCGLIHGLVTDQKHIFVNGQPFLFGNTTCKIAYEKKMGLTNGCAWVGTDGQPCTMPFANLVKLLPGKTLKFCSYLHMQSWTASDGGDGPTATPFGPGDGSQLPSAVAPVKEVLQPAVDQEKEPNLPTQEEGLDQVIDKYGEPKGEA